MKLREMIWDHPKESTSAAWKTLLSRRLVVKGGGYHSCSGEPTPDNIDNCPCIVTIFGHEDVVATGSYIPQI